MSTQGSQADETDKADADRLTREDCPSPSLSRCHDDSKRHDHLRDLLELRRASECYVREILNMEPTESADMSDTVETCTLSEKLKESMTKDTKFLNHAKELLQEIRSVFPERTDFCVEVAIRNLCYNVKVNPNAIKIRTVYNSSIFYNIYSWLKRNSRGLERTNLNEQAVLNNIDLTLKPGKMYLVLGPPGAGKTSLLKAIGGRLSVPNGEFVGGSVLYNGISMEEGKQNGLYLQNAISHIEQLENHAPLLSVKETLKFAFDCKAGGTHAPDAFKKVHTEKAKTLVERLDKENTRVNLLMEALGLEHVANTFVGNASVRGVSGGQRRRVTIGEMLLSWTPVLCGDEISTGLDAASTYDLCFILRHFTKLHRRTRVISLLQPSPETLSLFDEVILLSEGRILYAGPISKVEEYFVSLGYRAPDQMDVADFLLVLAANSNELQGVYSFAELADSFSRSEFHQEIVDSQMTSRNKAEIFQMSSVCRKYNTSYSRQTWLNINKSLTIWLRDKRFLMANAAKNLIMGVSVGGVFFQTESTAGIFGVNFQVMLFIMLGAMTSAPVHVEDRIIFYKQADANFYSSFPYVIGKAVAFMPQALSDVLIFGTIIYWMVGLAAEVKSYFIFLSILFVFSIAMNQMLALFSTFAKSKTEVQVYSAITLLLLVLFSGFIVSPDVIPKYYIWIYWWNPLAWAYRALLVNQFQSSEYDSFYLETNVREGDVILSSWGFTDRNNYAFQQEWVTYNFVYLLSHTLICLVFSGFALQQIRVSSGCASSTVEREFRNVSSDGAIQQFDIPFTPINLTFRDVCYDVKTSTGEDIVRLLTNVCGVFAPGRMCALMGSSGAGKTTLMDIIAMRKKDGTISGDIRINGFPQMKKSFRRCSGYVEQFDIQSPELTVNESVVFSARLRLDSSLPEVNNDKKQCAFVNSVLQILELSEISDSLVGDPVEGTGLSFEQRKRLSIAVELAASPSIIFLDEPTSGLDSRAALVVCKALKTIAKSGRTIMATIHQPSSAAFELFDDLLLLKGGQTVFFGELGESSSHLVSYFENKGATPIGRGENPANWMLKVITAEDTSCDHVSDFNKSTEFTEMLKKIEDITNEPDPRNEIRNNTLFAASRKTIQLLMNERLRTIYWRSPAYNLTRMLASCGIAFILGSVFMTNRDPEVLTETEMSSYLSTLFISFIIFGVLSITSVLPVMQKIRDSFYRHRAAGMIGSSSIALGLGTAEKYFIVVQGALFTIVFMVTIGLRFRSAQQYIGFFGFFTFNIAIYSYFGQAFMCSVRSSATAQVLASVFIGFNNFFSGLIVRPQYLSGLFVFTYWITPGHYVYEGLVMCLFQNDERIVTASVGSDFYNYLGCNSDLCQGNIMNYVDFFFGGKFNGSHITSNACVLGGILVVARLCTYFALRYFTFTAK